MDLQSIISALGRFGTGLSQHARLITLASAQEGGLREALMAERFSGREAVNELYAFDVDALSTSTDLDLAQFIGEELTVTLLQPDHTRRAWHGICTSAEWLGADGGVARYRLRLEPALALLRLRRDSYIFQDKNVQDIVTELFADYPQLRFEFDVTQELLARPICTQYRESDYEFFARLMASEGLSWRFEHEQGEVAVDTQARHQLVIFDSQAAAPATPGNPVIRFHGVRASESDDAIDGFGARRQAAANAVSISSWDPAQLLAPSSEQQSALESGDIPPLALFDGSGERIASEDGEIHSQLMLQALELANKLFIGEGAVRRLAAGHAFQLTRHERYPDGENAFKVLWVEHEARNNFEPQLSTHAQVEAGTYRNRFACVREAVPIVPVHTALPHPHTALGPQTALVVGVQNEVATTTRDHQVRVQFAWQRGESANAGGMAHDVDDTGSAPGDERSGTWVRVAEALAGPNWGTQFTPRIGTEVLVDFIENDIDRPVVVAQLYTGLDAPPFAAGVDSGVNHAGTISGIQTRSFDGSGFNQWQLDDTQGQLRMRLATSSAASQLNIGYLIAQSPGSAQRGSFRGTGFELRTDAWAVVRGGEGVLLTTAARAGQGSGVTSTQMDALEAVSALKAAQALDKTLLDAAKAQQALTSAGSVQAQKDLLAQIDPKEKGKYDGAVGGQEALKGQPGSRALDGGSPVEKFASPLVLMDAQASINWATPASTVLFAGGQLHWTTQSDLHMGAAYTVSSVSAEATALYSHEGGIQAFAGNGPVSLQAHTDQLEILADKELTVISVNDSIEIKAKQKIVLQAGQSSVTLDGANITFACPGNFTVKGGKHVFDGGGTAPYSTVPLPDTRLKLFDEAFVLKDAHSGQLLVDQPYRIRRADGTFEEGRTDDAGQTHLVRAAEAEPIAIELLPIDQGNVLAESHSNAFDEQILFKNAHGAALKNVNYTLLLAGGQRIQGRTNDRGLTQRIITDEPLEILEAKLQATSTGHACCSQHQAPTSSLAVPISGVATNSTDIGTSVAAVQTPAGEARPLTDGEINMARRIFGHSIDYSRVKVHKGEYLWFGLQPDDTAMTPNGEIYFNEARFLEDFSTSTFANRLWFIHEMVHVWQHQLGYPVKWRGAVRLGLAYTYTLTADKLLSDYNMEAQGNILADYWAKKTFGSNIPFLNENKHINDLALFEVVLKRFIADPNDKRNLPGG